MAIADCTLLYIRVPWNLKQASIQAIILTTNLATPIIIATGRSVCEFLWHNAITICFYYVHVTGKQWNVLAISPNTATPGVS